MALIARETPAKQQEKFRKANRKIGQSLGEENSCKRKH
jgi:hypothetical protein